MVTYKSSNFSNLLYFFIAILGTSLEVYAYCGLIEGLDL